ncbi:hypothetical protein ACWKWP_05650 [Agromyces soli]
MNDGIKWGVPALAIAALGTAGIALGLTAYAHVTSERAVAQASVAAEAVDEEIGDLKAASTLANGQASAATDLAEAIVDGYGDRALADALLADATTAATLVDEAEGVAVPPPVTTDGGVLPPLWVSFGEIMALQGRLAELDEIGADASQQAAALADAEQQLAEGRSALYADAAADAQAVLDASPFATYETRIRAMHAIAQEGDDWYVEQDDSVEGYGALVTASADVQASQASEAARRAAPEYATRGPIEEFARSIAHGVQLDFAWDHVVNGLSSDEWYSGTAQYWYGDGGWGKINLSYSIDWNYTDDINAKAVVVHEVGHVQVVRDECAPIFEGPVFNSDDEVWATAWAIASGYDVPGSGIEAYGRPSDEQIAAAAGCI